MIVIMIPDTNKLSNQFRISDQLCECDSYHRDSKLRLIVELGEVDNEVVCSGGGQCSARKVTL